MPPAPSGGLNSAEHGAHTRQQLLRAEWLGQVVVGAKVEGANLVRLLASGADHDDRGALLSVHVFEDLPTVDEGEADIEQDDVDRLRVSKHLRRRDPMGRQRRHVAGGVERIRKNFAQRRVVLDDQDAGLGLVAQQLPGPAGAAPEATVIVSENVAGGLKD